MNLYFNAEVPMNQRGRDWRRRGRDQPCPGDLLAETARLLGAEADPNTLAQVVSNNDQLGAEMRDLADKHGEEE